MRTKARFPVLLFLFVLMLFCGPARAQELPPAPLQYCIPSHERIAQDRFGDYAVEFLPLKTARLRVSLFGVADRDTPLRAWPLTAPAMKPRVFRWDGKLEGDMLPAGDYILRFEVMESGEAALDLPLAVLPPQEPLPLETTKDGDYLPLELDDASVWAAMTAPVAVVDIGDTGHLALRELPGAGRKTGEVHGQTAGLKILRLEADGYAYVGAYATDDGGWAEGYVPRDKLKMLSPDTRYGLLVDKRRQVMSVYERGAKLGELSISTGLMAKHRLLRETRAGAFLTGGRQLGFSSGGFRYDYAIRIDGGNLIHQLGWKRVDGAPSFAQQEALLGAKASDGCIRVQAVPSAEGLSALWLWTHLPRNTKVLVLDDPAERAQRYGELFPQPAPETISDESSPFEVVEEEEPLPSALPEASRTPVIRLNPDTKVLLTFMGDTTLGSEEKSRRLLNSFHGYIDDMGPGWPFSGVKALLAGDDVSVVNFEGVLKDDARDKEEGKQHWFRGPVSFADILPAGSVELAGLANNHVRDYGQAGRVSTKKALEGAGVSWFGYGDLYVFEKNGVKIGFGGIRETIFRQDRERAVNDIARLKAQGCHYIVYAAHFGNEYQPLTPLQRSIAYALIDAGADLVVGTHPHIVQGIEQYNQGLILYSLGNFIFGGNLELSVFDGLMARLELDFHEDTLDAVTLRLIPVLTTGIKPLNDFRPVIAKGEDKARILADIQAQSDMAISEEMVFPGE